MKTHVLTALLVLAFAGPGVDPAGAAEEERLKVLIITGGQGFKREPFFQMFRDNHEITFAEAQNTRTSAAAYDREDLFSYDVVILFDLVQEINERQKERFLELFEKGVGVVVLHHALVSYQKWPEYERIIGGIYPEDENRRGVVTDEVGYEHDVDIPVVIVAGDHPVTAGLEDFVVHDEIYWGFRVGADVTPLITTTHPRSGKPLGWVRRERNSRVVFIQLGHGPQIFEDSNYRRLVAQSIRWAANKPEEKGARSPGL